MVQNKVVSAEKEIIGRAEVIGLPRIGVFDIPARIDTGAKTSAIWASDIKETSDGLRFRLFDSRSPFYKDKVYTVKQYKKVVVASTIGESQERYKVKLLLQFKHRKIRASFTLSDRSQQVYPVLIGRNVLYKKFIVDVELGQPLIEKELQRSRELQSQVKGKGRL